MSRPASPWLMVAAVALVAMGASGSKAGERPDGSMSADKASLNQAAIERSWAIQGELARIEQNREAFVEDLLRSWTPYLDSAVYDPWTELKPIAMKATPWQLYGASLVGDFKTMVQLLRGEVGAGRYVNALTEPQARIPVMTQALGATTDSLVFTPIAPCRMVDTRGVGVRTGIVNPGTPRVFDLTTTGYTKGQGGATSGCAGLPSFSNLGWAANVTVTGHTASGNVRAYAAAGAVPATSFINFFPAASALANAGTLTGCYSCTDDVAIAAFAAPTHVIIDVMGYYEQATGFAVGTPVVTRLAGTSTSVAAGAFTVVYGASCPAGTVTVGGAMTNSGSTIMVSDQYVSGTQWYEFVRNTGGSAVSVTVYSTCLDIN